MSIQSINTDRRLMRAISSHRDHRGSKMRFLVVSAFLACAAAAPSQLLAPVAVPAPYVSVAGVAAVPVAYSAAIPTVSPGDIQAAAIDAQVKAQDLAIATADKVRELNEQAAENVKADVIVGTDAVKENSEEVFWAVQEKQWQALDAVKTAEAQLDGALARDAPVLAKNAVVGIAPVAPYVAGIAPIAFTPGFIAPALKTIETKPEEPKLEAKPEEKNEALVKSAEEKKADKESATMEASTKNLDAKPQLAPIIAPLAIQPYYNQGYPIVAPIALASPVLKYSAYPQVGLAPAIIKTAW